MVAEPKPSSDVDPVTAEVIRGGMETVAYEMATHVSLTATTPILNQSNERNATILDATGRLAALSVGIPQFMLSSTLPVRFALEQCAPVEDISRVFMGGPMMGPTVSNLDIPITKGTSGFIAFSSPQTSGSMEFPCIRCGYCVEACPLFLNPSQLGLLAKNERYEDMAEQYNLMDCFECGSCSYVCPAHIPLVQRFRGAKTMLRKQKASS